MKLFGNVGSGRSTGKYALIAAGVLFLGVTSCVQILGLSDNYALEDDAGSGDDGGPGNQTDGTISPGPDGATFDAGGDGASLDGGEGGALTYLEWSDAGNWTVYTSPPNMGAAYVGGTFDGRYVYFTPVDHTSKVIRYDSTALFAVSSSWEAFDAPGLLGTQGFMGATFDGRYVYFAGGNAASGTPSLSARFDTKAAGGFAVVASWEKFDSKQLSDAGLDSGTDAEAGADAEAGSYSPPIDQGFGGVLFDGARFVYLVPYGTGPGATQGIVTRFEADAGFADAAAWTTFDLQANVDPTLAGLTGGFFDGRYAYFIPQAGTKAARYDSTLGFKDAGSWSTYTVGADGGEYFGAGSDGTHVYASPHVGSAPVERFTPPDSFADASSWAAQPLTSLIGTYDGMAFDGRYLYVVPYAQTTIMQRLDTQAPDGGAWITLDLTKVGLDSGGAAQVSLAGAVFDGQFLYFPTWGAAVPAVVRLEARTPRGALPKGITTGSFL